MEGPHRNLLPDKDAQRSYSINNYGQELQTNKWRVRKAYDEVGVNDDARILLLACAFQETQHMSADERDAGKDDSKNGASNWSLWNLNEDMLSELGFDGGERGENFPSLNYHENLPEVVRLMLRGVQRWGAFRYLCFVRGGRTGFNDGVSYGIPEFVDGISTIMRVISEDRDLLWDGRRVDMSTAHV